jgi:hypothetical protein
MILLSMLEESLMPMNQLKLSRLREFLRQKSVFLLVGCVLFTNQTDLDEHLLYEYQLNPSTLKVFEAPPVKLERSASGRGRVKKEKYTVSSLPFPQGSSNVHFTQRWRKVFKPSLIFWASCQEDPFGTNALLDTVIEELWKRIFPSIASTYEESKAAICQVVSTVITSTGRYSDHQLFLIHLSVWSSRLAMCSLIGEASWERKGSL